MRMPALCSRAVERSPRVPLRGSYVFSSRTLGPLTFVVRNSLAFLQFLECTTFNTGEVEEDVSPISGINETEPLVHQFFDRAFSH